MRTMKMTKSISIARLILMPMLALFLAVAAHAAVPGITGTGTVGTFNLTAQTAFLNQPDGSTVYSWGYGCNGTATFAPALRRLRLPTAYLHAQPDAGSRPDVDSSRKGPVVVTRSISHQWASSPQPVNTSILFPGFVVTTTGGVAGLLTQEAASGGTVTYTFVRPVRRARTRITAGRKATCNSKWACTVLSSVLPRKRSPPPAQRAARGLQDWGSAGANGTAEAHWLES